MNIKEFLKVAGKLELECYEELYIDQGKLVFKTYIQVELLTTNKQNELKTPVDEPMDEVGIVETFELESLNVKYVCERIKELQNYNNAYIVTQDMLGVAE